MLVSAAGCGSLIPVYPPLTAVPAPVAGEIDEFLPQVRASLASDFPSVKILKLESGQRVWSITQAPSGVATGRYAIVHLGFEVDGKCYYQPRVAFQEAGATGWGGIQTSYSNSHPVLSTQKERTDALATNPDKRLPYKSEAVTSQGRPFGAGYPVDCAAMNKTLAFRPCTPTEAGSYNMEAICAQDGATPSDATPAAAPAPPSAPAAAPAPGPAPAADSPPAAAPTAPTPAAKGEAGKGSAGLDPKAPPECKAFVEKACNNPKIPAESRASICTQYVTAVNQVMTQSPGQAVEACKSLMKSAAN